VYDLTRTPLTKEGIALGRRLFYEGQLSRDGNYPCASCHQQVGAFTTYDHDLSHGYNNSHTMRNAPALANLAWQSAFGQDGRYTRLEDLFAAHLTAGNEMAETVDRVVAKLRAYAGYREAFRRAFGDESITGERMFNALAQFTLTMVSANSKWDKVQRGEATFSVNEASGQALFQQKCAACHAGPLFTDGSYRNIGLPLNPLLNDYGRMLVTGQSSDSLKFRVPSLRNLYLSSTYAHDGRIPGVQTMIHHYRTGVQASPTLDPLLGQGIGLNNADVADLAAFLRTLSDTGYIKDPRFAAP
jgi:cytochrome c peroxidase